MNGYTQINIGGKLRGFKWGKWAVEKYALTNSKRLLESNLGTEDFIFIVNAGLCMNCFCKQVEPDFTFENVVDWMEDFAPEELIKVNEAIESSNIWIAKKKAESELQLKSGGSKTRKKKSSPSVH